MRRGGDKKMADLLVRCGLLERRHADQALDDCAAADAPGFLAAAAAAAKKGERQLLEAVGREAKLVVEDLRDAMPPAEALDVIPAALAQRHLALPLRVRGADLFVAMADPFDFFVVEDIQMRTGLEVNPVLALEGEIREAIRKAYARTPDAGAGELGSPQETVAEEPDVDASLPEVERILNAVLLAGITMKASHIHVEPMSEPGQASAVELRYRVDGKLIAGPFKVPWAYHGALVAKLKIMTNSMNITERRIPQSGRLAVSHGSLPVEFRVETLPTIHGEALVLTMRETEQSGPLPRLEQLGIAPETLARLSAVLTRPGDRPNPGLVLVCGPTGAGKTTLLYAVLSRLNRPETKIVTAENPVERPIRGVVQVPVNPDIGLGADKQFGFAAAVRSFARFDPDVVMVGELRDQETAAIAVEAAMRGVLVLSTLHVNRAVEAPVRLLDMGVPGNKVAMTLKAVVCLGLVRRLCADCRVQRPASPHEAECFRQAGVDLPAGAMLSAPPEDGGCPACHRLGFKGQIGLQEVLVIDDEARAALSAANPVEALSAAARSQGMRPLGRDALEKVKLGLTTLAEVLTASSLVL